ncbi:MAG TPA: hypothetical protein VHG33_11725 [Woeseiaceae bacterium]|nr:hypothetical protein [Woeseiaceae bacterium]
MKKYATAALMTTLVLTSAGCAAFPESDRQAAENAEWYEAFHADMRRCERIGGTTMVARPWASRLVREVRPGSRYICYRRDRHGPAWNRTAWTAVR